MTASTNPYHLLVCGCGYLGQALAQQALASGFHVSTCTLSGGGGSHACDLGNADSVSQLASKIAPPDAIVHCASSGRGGAAAYEHVYRKGCLNLQERFPHAVLLYTSSSSVYGQCDGSVVSEESPTLPDRETGEILLAAESIVLQAQGIVCRLSGIYGPGRSMILKKFLQQQAVIEEDGRRYLNQIHRDDAVSAIMLLLLRSLDPITQDQVRGHIFNVTDSHPLTQIETYQALAESFQQELPPNGPRDLQRKRGWTHKQVSNQKLRLLGWRPQFASFLDAVYEVAPTISMDA